MNDPLVQLNSLVKSLSAEKAKLEARLEAINTALRGFGATTGRGGKRTFSAATKAKMAASQKARWAKLKTASAVPVNRRKMSAKGRAKIAAAAKARWAKAKAAGQKTLQPKQ